MGVKAENPDALFDDPILFHGRLRLQVVTKIVQVEVESEELKAQVAVLSDKIFDLERRCADREKTVSELQMKTESLKDQVSSSIIMQAYRIYQR